MFDPVAPVSGSVAHELAISAPFLGHEVIVIKFALFPEASESPHQGIRTILIKHEMSLLILHLKIEH
ncbi:hypothetical protein MWU38_03680 [Qipengyuania sp. S6317L1]|uniref:hypothetical protein n=1 Tax=Qipengyuania sp. S6317L1 TaxID=2926410 RepID=UPI001FF1E24C|nr:hypothetical protein [Qipengyuania sp. S6317L1]MCK0098476.1 hypothetical protein [Qipengyuania sp. S6317L1]